MKGSKQAEASISIYLALVFTIILSFILLIIEGARENAIRMKAECAMDLSMSSVFAEYNRQLLEQYDLFFIDTSYGQPGASPERIGEHLKAYLEDNFQTGEEMGIIKDLLSLQAEEVNIMDYSLASDQGGVLIKRQAVSYMKDLYGITYLEELQRQLNTIESDSLFTRDITGERLANQSAIDNFEIPPRQVGEDQWEEVELNNPADGVNAARGVLALVIDGESQLSTSGVNLSNYISARTCNQGNGLAGRDKLGVADELIFNEYLIHKCGSYTNPKETGALQYQLEYILIGGDKDAENLKAVVNRLLLLRETANVVYLFSDSAKVAEAEALALAVTSAIALPELAELVKISLIFAWAYAESVYDVRMLLQGGKIPLMKNNETWHYSISGMLDFASDTSVDTENSTGISYEEYLRVFLAIENVENKTNRAMDIMEMDVRKCPGNTYFRLDTCVDYIQAEVLTSSGYGYNHSITRSYYYY
ncbi:MAG: hypothetical protein J6K58_03395 [Lachnospiraceae bacterium]|nr:hypothetical protein [Lachnospiraceae bacterium]